MHTYLVCIYIGYDILRSWRKFVEHRDPCEETWSEANPSPCTSYFRKNGSVREEEKFRRQVVAEARRRLLEEHAANLHGFLPKGVVKNKEEYEILRRVAQKEGYD